VTNSAPKPRGFAAMDPAKQRLIAAKGGASVPDHKRSFSQSRDLAAKAGRAGGEASQTSRKAAKS
jgi:general stress protein YciG